jgi:hypothetical protein
MGVREKLRFRPPAGLDALLVRNAVLLIATFRIYRFWARTDLRRCLWASVWIGDEALEYTGRATDLFFGFLLVFSAMVVPLSVFNGLLVIGAVDRAAISAMQNLYYVAWAILLAGGQYAARRYQLSCTLWRGIYATQDGSSWRYAWRWAFWAGAFCLTAGLSVPWACADLASYRMQHTLWGNYRGDFHGRARALLKPWLIAWGLCFGPLYVASLWCIGNADWDVSALFWQVIQAFDFLNDRAGSHLLYGIVPVTLCVFFVCFWFFGRWLEWYIDGISLGPMHFVCRLPDNAFHASVKGFALAQLYAFIAVAVIIHANLDRSGAFYTLSYAGSVWACLAATAIASAGLSIIWYRQIYLPFIDRILSHTAIDNINYAEDAVQAKVPQFLWSEGLWDMGHGDVI